MIAPPALFLFAALAAQAPSTMPSGGSVHIAFALVREPKLAVHATIEADGDASGETVFAIAEEFGGVHHFETDVSALRVATADGKPCETSHAKENEWAVRHAPGARLRLDYDLSSGRKSIEDDSSFYYRLVLLPGVFHLIGEGGLVLPKHLRNDAPRDVEFEWRGFREAGWRTANSFGIAEAGFKQRASLAEIAHAVYFAGDLQILEAPVPGGTLALVVYGKEWEFDAASLMAKTRAVVRAEREFFADETVPYYLVTLLPIGEKDAHRRSLGGTGLTHSFSLFMRPSQGLETAPGPGMSVMHLLAHEMFHHWNGRVVQRVEPEELVYWFSEGFTDFFARRILLRAGLDSPETAVDKLNRSLESYYLSPVAGAPNARIAAEFWTDRNVTDLPYRRGDAIACAVDAAIRRASKGRASLDDLFKDLVARSRRETVQVSVDSLLRDVAARTDDAFAAALRKTIVDGAPLEFPSDWLAPAATVEYQQLGAYDPGFDLAATRTAKTVSGVVEGGAAWKAGLRNGLKLKGWSYSTGEARVPMELTIVDGGADRVVRFLPQGEPRRVPVVKLAAGRGEELRRRL